MKSFLRVRIAMSILVAGGLLLAGCSGPEQGMPFSPGGQAFEQNEGLAVAEDSGTADMAVAGGSLDGGGMADRVSITGDAQVVTSKPAEASATFRQTVISVGGQVDIVWENDHEAYTSASVAVRVPAEEYDGIVEGLHQLGKVESSSTSMQDLEQTFIDVEAHRKALEASLERVKKLANEATSTSELLQAEEMLTQQQAELDSLNQQLEWLEGQVEMATLNVTFDTSPQDPGPAISFGWVGQVLLWSLYTIAWTALFLIPWAVILIPLALLWRRSRAKKATRQ